MKNLQNKETQEYFFVTLYFVNLFIVIEIAPNLPHFIFHFKSFTIESTLRAL